MPQESEKLSVLMVCLGNICRSATAEAVFRDTAAKRGLADRFSRIDSAGTASYHIGSQPDRRAIEECRRHDVHINHQARQVSTKDFREFDYIFAMDESNLEDLQEIEPNDSKAKVMMFGVKDFNGSEKTGAVVEDPYYGRKNGFQENFEQLKGYSEKFMDEIVEK